MRNDVIQKEIDVLEALKERSSAITAEISSLEQELASIQQEMRTREYALDLAYRALGLADEDKAVEEPPLEERIFVDDEKARFMRKEGVKEFWFEHQRHGFETRLRMMTTMMELLEAKDPERFDEFINSDLSKYRGDGINNLTVYISTTAPSEEDASYWYRYKDGLWVKRNGLGIVNTMRVIEILLNAFSIDRHSFYIIFKEKAEEPEDELAEDGYEEDDPDQLGLDLDGTGDANA